MKLQTNLVRISPYFLFVQQVKDNLNFVRAAKSGVDMMPLQLGGLSGQLATLDEQMVLQLTEFDGSETTGRVIAPTLLK